MRKPTIVKREELPSLAKDYFNNLFNTKQYDLILNPKAPEERFHDFKFKAVPMREMMYTYRGKNISTDTAYKLCKRFNKEMAIWTKVISELIRSQNDVERLNEMKEKAREVKQNGSEKKGSK